LTRLPDKCSFEQMKKDRPIGVDLFAGAGGMSLGFEQAGVDVLAAVEIDPIHAAVHKFNFPDCSILPKSVQDVTGDEIRSKSAIGQKPVDIVFGGAPCQGFSLIGQRVLDDPRNSLVKDFVRLVSELDASYFVFENVKGLTVGKHRKFLEELIEAFKTVGYNIRPDWRVLNAANYGVPQDRQRLFLLGARKGLTPPLYPDQLTTRAGKRSELILPRGPSCEDALGDLPDAEQFDSLNNTDEFLTGAWEGHSDYSSKMRCETSKAWQYGYKRSWSPELLTSSIRTKHSDISRNRFAETPPGTIEPISRFFKLSANGVSNTLRAGTDAARGAFTSPRPIHYKYHRCVTVREMARLHGFPDWFRLHRTKWHGARQIGNAVPPPLAYAVALELIKVAGITPTRPGRTLAPGDTSLLCMDMSQAAAYWDVPAPLGKRDRKSGARKRSQAETEIERLKLLTT
jgi:DNA (cytosine-5)-methyltransferase 1